MRKNFEFVGNVRFVRVQLGSGLEILYQNLRVSYVCYLDSQSFDCLTTGLTQTGGMELVVSSGGLFKDKEV